MGDNEPEVFELESLDSAPKEKVEIIHMQHMYYFSFHNCGELMELLERHCEVEILVCIDLSVIMKDEFIRIVADNHDYHFFKQQKRQLQYVQVRLEKEMIKESESFFEFIDVLAGMNDFIFIVINPKGELPHYLLNDKVRVDTSKDEKIYVFDYDGPGAFIFS
jgi:hypothetical protein